MTESVANRVMEVCTATAQCGTAYTFDAAGNRLTKMKHAVDPRPGQP
ncbi:MAG: hypothetical protein GW880_24330 [Armatimonadetes bacterium]|nr:hypothetical protein [Armatimonadota bacterium]